MRVQLVGGVLAIALFVSAADGQGRLEADVVGGYSSGEMIVRVTEGARDALDGVGGPLVNEVLARVGASVIERAYPFPFARPEIAGALGLDRYYRVRLGPGADAPAAARELSAMVEAFETVELSWIGGVADEPNDEHFGLCWGLRNIGQAVPGGVTAKPGADVRAVSAWMEAALAEAPLIAVIDSGINPHPDLAGRLAPGWNFVDNSPDTTDLCDHGTHVSGIIGAIGDNGVGIPGMTWNATLMPVRVLQMCSGTEATAANGVIYAADKGARIASMSLQYFAGTSYFKNAVLYADQSGTLLVAASGNNNAPVLAYPAAWAQVVSAGAVNAAEERAEFSNYGPDLDLSAPGVDVFSLDHAGGYRYGTGTSMAAPHVSGAAALMWAKHPGLSREEVRGVLVSSARDIGAPGPDPVFGRGMVDASAALSQTPCYADFDRSGSLDLFDFLAFQSAFLNGDASADCNGTTLVVTLDLFDFLCFVGRFNSGC